MLDTPLNRFIKYIEKADIPYVILRGYDFSDRIFQEKEIDIYIDQIFRDKALAVFSELGWKRMSVAVPEYPHEQFYGKIDNILTKFDVIWKPVWGKGLIACRNIDLINTRIMMKCSNGTEISVFEPKTAIILLVLHVIYDKKNLSMHNKEFLNFLLEHITVYKNEINASIFKVYFMCIIEKLLLADGCTKYRSEIVHCIRASKIVRYSWLKCFSHRMCIILHRIFAHIKKFIWPKTYCFVGIDGVGKSTAVRETAKFFEELSSNTYMGNKGGKKNHKIFRKIALWIDLWGRYLKALLNGREVVLFDRYSWDNYIFSLGKKRVINFILFRMLFPTPRTIFYLYCPFEISLKRKTDIEQIDLYKSMKETLDEFFLDTSIAISINTNEKSQGEMMDIICEKIYADLQDI